MTQWATYRLVLTICTVILSCRSNEVRVCKHPPTCEEPNCYQKEVECVSGQCSDKGQCVCEPCWTGPSCDIYENKHQPQFWRDVDTFEIAGNVAGGTPVFQVTAYDLDTLETCPTGWKNQGLNCTCAEVLYSIDESNDHGLFSIDPHTGELSIKVGTPMLDDTTYKLVVGARNPVPNDERQTYAISERDLAGSRITLEITVADVTDAEPRVYDEQVDSEWHDKGYSKFDDTMDNYYDEEVHSRHKREVTVDSPIPDNLTFYLERHPNITQIYDGTELSFRVTIHFPSGSSDVVVELFSSDNDTTQAMLCNPRVVHVGDNLNMGNVTPVLESVYGNGIYDRAILNLGTVENSGTDSSTPNASMVFIDYKVYKITSNLTVSGEEYWLSAGASFNNDSDIWVAQVSYITETDVFNTSTPANLTLNGPPQVEIGSAAKFTLDMYIPYPTATIAVDAFTPYNTSDVMSMCSVTLKNTGLNYACLNNDAITSTIYPYAGGNGNNRGRLNLGQMVNTAARDETNYVHDESRLSVEFVLFVNDDQSFLDQEYWVGAAVEIGEDEIWAGQLAVTAVNYTEKAINTTENLSFSLTATNESLAIGESVLLDLDITVPENTETAYKLTVLTPFNDTARAKVCHIYVESTGRNIPCVSPGIPVFTSLDNSSVSTKATLNLGSITNAGVISSASNNSENMVKVKIAVQILDHELNYNGGDLQVTVGVEVGPDKIWVAERLFTAGNDTKEISNLTAADIAMSYAFGDEHVHINAVKDVRVTITTMPAAIYYPGRFEFVLPVENDSAILTVCRAELIHVGSNLPCFNGSAANSTFVYSSRTNDTSQSKVAIDLGYICNIGSNTVAQTEADQIILKFIVRQEDHVAVENGTEKWLSAGMQYFTSELWVGQINSVTLKDMNIVAPSDYDGLPLFVTPTDKQTSNMIAPGSVITFDIMFKVPPQSTVGYSISVTTNCTLTVCALRYVETGWNIPCLSTTSIGEVTFGAGSRTTASMSLGHFTNIGSTNVSYTDVFDNETVRLQVVLQLTGDEAIATNGSEHWFRVDLDYGGAQPAKADAFVQAIHKQADNVTTLDPNVLFNYVSEAGTQFAADGSPYVTKGQSVRFSLELTLPENTAWHIQVKFLTPLNTTSLMHICDASVIHVGSNFPCVVKETVVNTYESRTGSAHTDIGSIDMGYVCSIPTGTATNTSNTIIFDAAASVLRDVTLEQDDTFWFGSTVTVNSHVIYVSQLSLKYTETLSNSYTEAASAVMNCSSCSSNITNVYVNGSSVSPRPTTIAERFSISVVLTVPQNLTVPLTIDVRVPVNETAVMTITDAALTRAGANLCGLSRQMAMVTPVYNMSLDNNQVTGLTVDLHAVTNTGVTARVSNYTYSLEDDQLVFDVNLQMADSVANEHLTVHAINVGVEMGSMVYVAKEFIEVQRTTNEKPELEVAVTMDTSTTYAKGSTIEVTGNIKHTEQSKAEANNVTVSFYLPPSLNFSSFTAINLTMNAAVDENGLLSITIPQLLFADTNSNSGWFTLSLTVNPDYGRENIESVIVPYDACFYMFYRQFNANPDGTEFCSSLQDLEFTINPQGWPSCETALGMQSLAIQDCQIKGSPSSTSVTAARYGYSGWKGFYRGEVYEPYRYLQIELGNNTKLTQLLCNYVAGSDVTQIEVMTSNDGLAWLSANTLSIPVRSQRLLLYPPIEAPFVRFYLYDSTSGPSEIKNTFEVYGCNTGGSRADVCKAPVSSTEAHKFRGFLVTTSTTYVCDFKPDISLQRVCYSTTDGDTWTEMDSRVANVIGFDIEEGYVYAVGTTDDTYLVAQDGTDTWYSISPARWAEFQSCCAAAPSRCRSTVEVSWLNSVANPSSFIQENWGANFNGMYNSDTGVWVQHLDWTD